MFDQYWKETFTDVPVSTDGSSIFDHCYDASTHGFVHWKTKLSPHASIPDQPFANVFVATVATIKYANLVGLLLPQRYVFVCMYVCMYACIHDMHVYATCIHAHTYVSVRDRHMCVCMYMYLYMHLVYE
jgi:hypothetical protein